MKIIQPPQLDDLSACPYLPDRQKQYEFFLAGELNADEVVKYLAGGWRKFGVYYFRPACPDCRRCIPLRVPTEIFSASRSQRRVLKKNAGLEVRFAPLHYSERAFAIYRDHSRERFADEARLEDFLYNFYLPSCPTLQSETYLNDELIAVGFLDRGENCLSSVYCCFDPRYSHLNLGTFSILQEIAYARELGLAYYYLGYYVPGCSRMSYKDHFLPREYFDWELQSWRAVAAPPESVF